MFEKLADRRLRSGRPEIAYHCFKVLGNRVVITVGSSYLASATY